MLPVPPGTELLRTGEVRIYGIDLAPALLPGDAIASIVSLTCDRTTTSPFAEQWTADNGTITAQVPTGSVNGTTLTSPGGTYAASTTIPLTVGAPAAGGIQAVIHAVTNASGVVQSPLVIDNPGNGYPSAPTITFPPANSGGTATATATILKDTVTVTLDATKTPAVVGDWRRVIAECGTNYGEVVKSDAVDFFTDL